MRVLAVTPDKISHTELAIELLKILNEWQVEPAQQIILLGFPADTKPRLLNRLKMGQMLPVDKNFLSRAHYLLAIYNAVQSVYPHNASAANYWVTTPSYYFGNKTPLETMLNNGVEGMKYVLSHLNGTDDWSL